MTTLTVTAKGQVTLKKELLQYLGVKPGQKIEVEMLAGGRLALAAMPEKTGSWDEFFGILGGLTDKVATIEEMNDAIEKGWAGLLNEDNGGYQSPREDGDTGRREAGAHRAAGGGKR